MEKGAENELVGKIEGIVIGDPLALEPDPVALGPVPEDTLDKSQLLLEKLVNLVDGLCSVKS